MERPVSPQAQYDLLLRREQHKQQELEAILGRLAPGVQAAIINGQMSLQFAQAVLIPRLRAQGFMARRGWQGLLL
jgi:hypothetical protein